MNAGSVITTMALLILLCVYVFREFGGRGLSLFRGVIRKGPESLEQIQEESY